VSIDLACIYRSKEPIGRLPCKCSTARDAYQCSHPSLKDKIVSLNAVKLRGNRIKPYRSGPAIELDSLEIPICITCEYKMPETPSVDLSVIAGRSESLQKAISAICSNCPRLDTKGNPVVCNGEYSETCPKNLFPLPSKKKSRPSRRGSCCG